MFVLAGPVAAAAALLVAGGVPKVGRPAPAVGALRSVGLRLPAAAVRALGAAEAVIGLLALVTGGRLPVAAVAASYAGFTAFVVVALRRGGAVSSCGCVGRADTPPTKAHVAVTGVLAALAALAAVIDNPLGLVSVVRAAPTTGLVVIGLATLTTWLAWLVLAELPRLRPAPARAR